MAFSDDDPAPDEDPFFLDSFINFTATVSGTYFVGISAFGNESYDPNVAGSGFEADPSDLGEYSVTIEMIDPAVPLSEPNDTIVTAFDSGLSSANPGEFVGAGEIRDDPALDTALDVDLIGFQLDAGDRVTIDIDADQLGLFLDPVLRLFDANGNQLAFSDDNPAPGEPFNFDSYIDFTASVDGFYFIGVSDFENDFYDPSVAGSVFPGFVGEYTIIIEVGNADERTEIAEPNDSIAAPFDSGLSSLAPGTFTARGTIGDNPAFDPGLDVDLIAVQLNAGDRVTIDVDADEFGSSLDGIIRLFNENGNVVAFSDDDPAPGELFSFSFDPYIDFTAAATGPYFIGISGFGNRFYDPSTAGSGSDGSTGFYNVTVDVTVNEPILGVHVVDLGAGEIITQLDFGNRPITGLDDDVGDDIINATELFLNSNGDLDTPFLSVINFGGDLDIFRVQATVSGFLEIRQTGADFDLGDGSFTKPPLDDPFLVIRNQDGDFLTSDDDSGGNLNSRAIVPVRAGDVIFIEAGAFSFGEIGGYEIAITTLVGDVQDDFSDALDPNDPGIGVVDVSGGSAMQSGEIEVPFDRDVFRIENPSNGFLQIGLEAGLPNAFLDPFLRVFDAGGVLLVSDDDSGSGLASRLVLPVRTGETLLVEAGGFGASTGNYNLSFDFTLDDNVLDGISAALDVGSAVPVILDPNVRTDQPGTVDFSGDRDTFLITVVSTGSLNIGLSAADGSGLDPVLEVFDLSGRQVAFDDDGGEGLNSFLTLENLNVGDMLFVRARGFESSIGDYVLSFESATDDVPDNLTSAQEIILDASGNFSVITVIDRPGDRDVFRVEVPQDVTALTIRQRSTAGSSLDSFLRVFNSNGELLGANDNDGFNSGTAGFDLDSGVTIPVSAGDTLLIQAAAFGAGTGGYELTIAPGNDDVSNGLNIGASKLDITDFAIDFEGDRDVFRFTSAFASGIDILLEPQGAGPNALQGTLRVFQALNDELEQPVPDRLIAVRVADEPGGNVMISVDFPSEDFFVDVSGFGTSTGEYQLTLQGSAGPNPLAGGPSPVFNFGPNDVGDTFVDAEQLVLDDDGTIVAPLAGTITDDDVDTFFLVASTNGLMTVDLSVTGGSLNAMLAAFRLVSDSTVLEGQEGEQDDQFFVPERIASDGVPPSAAGNRQISFQVLRGDTIFVQVSGNGGTIGDYTLGVSTAPQTGSDLSKLDDETGNAANEVFRQSAVENQGNGGGQNSDEVMFRRAIEDAAVLVQAKLGAEAEFLIIGLDPVDFVVTDAEGRRAGFTASEGRINEIGDNVFFSGDGVAELMIIGNPNLSNLTLAFDSTFLGVSFAGAAALVSSDFNGTRFDSINNLTTFLDFSDIGAGAAPPGASAIPTFSFSGGAFGSETAFGFGLTADDALAFEESIQDEIALLLGLDSENESLLPWPEVLRGWLETIRVYTGALVQTVSGQLETALIEEFVPLHWFFRNGEDDESGDENDADAETNSKERDALFDLFWAGVGRSLLGIPGDLSQFGDLFGKLINEFQEESESSEREDVEQNIDQPNPPSRKTETPPARIEKSSDNTGLPTKAGTGEKSAGEAPSREADAVATRQAIAVRPSTADESRKQFRQPVKIGNDD